jgi:flagellar biosynthesis protein FliP
VDTGEVYRWLPWVALAVGPLLLATLTCYAKVSVVLAAARVAIGGEGMLPWLVIVGAALAMSLAVMAPVIEATLAAGVGAGARLGALEAAAIREVMAPWLGFVARHADPAEVTFVAQLHGRPPEGADVLAIAFVLTELREALMLAALVLAPFVVVDVLLVHASALMGLPQLAMSGLALPLKLLLFLGLGGFSRLLEGLAGGYGG